jgi:DNA polymerase elongation subunit (family B)
MKHIYHSDAVRSNGSYIFYKELIEQDGEISKNIDYIKPTNYNYAFYKKDKEVIPENDNTHYFVSKENEAMEKYSKSILRNNWEELNTNKVYGYYSPEKRFRLDKLKKSVPLTYVYKNISIMYLDIEVYVDSKYDIFDRNKSVFERYKSPILTISSVVQNNCDGSIKKVVFVWDMYKREKVSDENKDYEIFYFDDEKSLLKGFCNFIMKENPDIMTGWNIFFDLPYIYVRLVEVFKNKFYGNALSPYFSKLLEETKLNLDANKSELVSLYEKQEKKIINGAFLGWEFTTNIKIGGINVIDYKETTQKKDAIKGDNKDSYTLNHVSTEELGLKKVDYSDYGDLNTLYEKDLETFLDYNMEDSNLVYLLEKKLGYLKILVMTNAICQIQNIEKSNTPVPLWEDTITMYNDKILNQYELYIDKKNRKTLEGRYPGALDMNVDMIQDRVNKCILTYDWSSLYPTTIISTNTSPEKKKNITKGKYNTIKELIYFLHEKGESLERLLDKDKIVEELDQEINNIQEAVFNGKYRKKSSEDEINKLKEKKNKILDGTLDLVDQEFLNPFIKHYNDNSQMLSGIDEIDKVLQKVSAKIKGYSYGITAFYKNDNQGVIPLIMNEKFNLRFKYKKLVGAIGDLFNGGLNQKEFKKKVEQIGLKDDDEYKNFLSAYKSGDMVKAKESWHFIDDLQNTLKLFLNSGYGALGNKYFVWYDRDIASSVTLSARKVLNDLLFWVSRFINKELNTPNKKRIVYGATDSIFVEFLDLFDEEEYHKLTNKQIVDTLFNFLEAIDMENYINEFYAHLKDDVFNAYTNKWNLEMEKLARETIFFGQKNYLLRLIYKGSSFTKDEEYGYKTAIKGIKIKKVDTPAFLRTEEKQEQILDMIFKSRKVNYELLKFEEWIYSLYDEYVQTGNGNPFVVGGSMNVKSEKINEYLNDDISAVIKNRCPAQYSGMTVWNNYMDRLKEDGIETKYFRIKNEGINSKIVPVYVRYDNDYIVERIEYERKTTPKRKVLSMVVPFGKYPKELLDHLHNIIDYQELFIKKVLKNLTGYIKLPEDLKIEKKLKQRNIINISK